MWFLKLPRSSTGWRYALVGPAKVNRTQVINNAADMKGGGLYYDGRTPINITDSLFSLNKATSSTSGMGGAIFDAQSETYANISGTRFEKNFAGFDGGAIFGVNNGIHWAIKVSQFLENKIGSLGNCRTLIWILSRVITLPSSVILKLWALRAMTEFPAGLVEIDLREEAATII
jgi:hypothetical protein